MNRIIKFRGKRVDNGEWVYGNYLHANGNSKMLIDRTHSNPENWVYEDISFDSHLICNFIPPDTQGWDYNEQVLFHNVIPETVGQFTGILTKSGIEIFDGDKFHLGDPKIQYEVIFHDNGFKGQQIGSLSKVGLYHWQNNIEITGNIHDND